MFPKLPKLKRTIYTFQTVKCKRSFQEAGRAVISARTAQTIPASAKMYRQEQASQYGKNTGLEIYNLSWLPGQYGEISARHVSPRAAGPRAAMAGRDAAKLPRQPGEIVFIIMEPILNSNRESSKK